MKWSPGGALRVIQLTSACVEEQPGTEIYFQRMFRFACDLSRHFRSTDVYYSEHAAQHVLLTHVLSVIKDADIFFVNGLLFTNPYRQNSRGFLREMLDWRGSLSAWPPMISIRKTRSKTLHNGLCVYRQTSCNPQSHNTAKQNSRIYISEFTVWSMECSLIGRWL